MRSIARKVEPEVAYTEVGTVERVSGRTLVVASGGVEREARRAASCLIEPAAGDLCLYAVAPGRGAYVLSVLERQDGAARVVLDGDLEVRLPKGRFVLCAAEGVNIVTGKAASVVAGEIKVNARAGSVLVESLAYLGTFLGADVEKVKVAATTLDSTVDRVTQRLKRAYRFVSEFEHLRAGRVDYAAEKSMSLRGENTLVTAEELVKLDGAQIHLG